MSKDISTPEVRTVLPLELKLFLCISALLWVCSLAFVAYRLYAAPQFPHGLPLPFYTPPFTDLNAVNPKLGMVHQPEFFTVDYKWIYPAPCLFLYKFILHFNQYNFGHGRNGLRNGEIAYCFMILAGLLLLIGSMASALARRGLSRTTSWFLMAATALLSWPLLFGAHTGNIESILWFGVAIACWAYYRRWWWVAALVIGFVGAFKIYPILLIGLFLRPRKFRQIAASLLVFATLTILGLAYIGPTISIAYRNVANGMKSFTDLGFYPGKVDRDYLTLEHSLVSLIRICTSSHPELMRLVFHYYMPVAGLFMLVLFFAKVWRMPRLNQLFIILLAAVLLPPKSYDYTLAMLYIPWAWLTLLAVSAARRGAKIPGVMPVMVCMALVCSPEFFIKAGAYYSFGQFKAVVLVVLLWLVVRYPFSDTAATESSTPLAFATDRSEA